MLKIWKEQMTLLDVIDTGALLASPKSLPLRADGQFMELGLSQSFLESGLWQNFGTGKEIPRGNNGDIGRERKRKKKPWFSRKYYASVMNLRDFLADNMAKEFVGVVAQSLDDKYPQIQSLAYEHDKHNQANHGFSGIKHRSRRHARKFGRDIANPGRLALCCRNKHGLAVPHGLESQFSETLHIVAEHQSRNCRHRQGLSVRHSGQYRKWRAATTGRQHNPTKPPPPHKPG